MAKWIVPKRLIRSHPEGGHAVTAMEHEVTAPTPLCDAKGNLHPEAAGWAKHPHWDCNLKGHALRKKRWDYWCFVGPERLCSLCIAHVDYFGLLGAYLLDYPTRNLAECGMVRPLAREPQMPSNTFGNTRAAYGRTRMEQELDENGGTLLFEAPNCAGRPLRAEFRILSPAAQETLNVVVPWSRTQFQFTSKQLPLACEGTVQWGDETWRFDRSNTFGVRDFGRGVWPYRTTWNWAALSGTVNGVRYGVNLGGKWTDGTGATENGLIFDGRFFPIAETVRWEYDTRDWLKPWRLYTPGTDTVDLTLTPFFDKPTKVETGILSTRVHQCFGHFSGSVNTGGHRVEVDQALGWAEEQRARW
jgi:hypothetical protein